MPPTGTNRSQGESLCLQRAPIIRVESGDRKRYDAAATAKKRGQSGNTNGTLLRLVPGMRIFPSPRCGWCRGRSLRARTDGAILLVLEVSRRLWGRCR
eukprot:930873-Prorocentrum_minimum.AAC.1